MPAIPEDLEKKHLSYDQLLLVARAEREQGDLEAFLQYPDQVEHLMFCDRCAERVLITRRALERVATRTHLAMPQEVAEELAKMAVEMTADWPQPEDDASS